MAYSPIDRLLFACMVIILFAAFAVSQVNAGTIIAGSSPRSYIDLANNPAYDSVGKISWDGGLASGTYIGDKWVLTAAHVAESSKKLTFNVGGKSYRSNKIVIHDDWDGNVNAGKDIALIKLSRDVKGIDAATLYDGSLNAIEVVTEKKSKRTRTIQYEGWQRFNQQRALILVGPFRTADEAQAVETTLSTRRGRNNDPLIGEQITLVGFGKQGDGVNGSTSEPGRKLAGQNIIDATGAQVGRAGRYGDSLLLADFDDPNKPKDGYTWSDSKAVALEYMVTPGDSGGGVFVNVAGKDMLLGMTSFVLALDGDVDSDYGDVAGIINLDDYAPWIHNITGIGSANAARVAAELRNANDHLVPLSGATTAQLPEPASLTVLALAAALCCPRRRRK